MAAVSLFWDTNMAAVLLFWDTNLAAVTSCENTLLKLQCVMSQVTNGLGTRLLWI